MDKILNPKSNRFVKVGTQKFKRLVAEGIIKPVGEIKQVEPVEQVTEVKPVKVEQALPIKEMLANELTDIVAEHKKQLTQELTQKQTEALLRKLLYERLCIVPKTKKEKPVKKKKKSKAKFRVVESSSESESSESE